MDKNSLYLLHAYYGQTPLFAVHILNLSNLAPNPRRPYCCLIKEPKKERSETSSQSHTKKQQCVSCLVGSDSQQPHELQPIRLLCPWSSPDKNIGVHCHSLLQRIFLTQELNHGLLHCRQILYCLSYREVLINASIRLQIQKPQSYLPLTLSEKWG